MRLRKIKRPQGDHFFEVQPWADDEFGVWLFARTGARWHAPHAIGTLGFDVLLLLQADRNWVAWWVDDPGGRHVVVDICLLPVREPEGWSFVDLELDPSRHESGLVDVEDRDEFEAAVQAGWIAPPEAALAEATALVVVEMLGTQAAPFGDQGWVRLDAAQRSDWPAT